MFVTDDFINSPVDLAGRLRISTFGPYVSNLGYDPGPRAAATKAIYCDGPDVAAQPDGRLRRDVRAVERRGARAATQPGTDFAVERQLPDRLRPGRRPDLARAWHRRRTGRQPLGSTTTVTSGVMPVKTLIATL